MSLMFLALAGGFFTTSTTWEALEPPYDTAIQFLGIYTEKNENPNSKRCIYINIHSSTIYNRQDMKVTCVHQQINKVRIYIYIYINTLPPSQEYTEELYKKGVNDQWCHHSPRARYSGVEN